MGKVPADMYDEANRAVSLKRTTCDLSCNVPGVVQHWGVDGDA